MNTNLKYYTYKKEAIYIFILTLKDTLDWRVTLVNNNISKNPKINKLYGIDGNNKIKIQSLIKSNYISLPKKWINNKKKTYGKLGRWLSTILIAKLSLMNKSKIIVLEDDLNIPTNFDFKFKKYINASDSIVRLGKYGDGYYFNPKSSLLFLKKVYKIGLLKPDDLFIMQLTPSKKKNIISRKRYAQQKNLKKGTDKSSINVRNEYVDYYNLRKQNDPKPLLDKVELKHNSDNPKPLLDKVELKDIPDDLNRLLDKLE